MPRPDTETVVAAALAFVDRDGRRDDELLAILDLGTGSGAILSRSSPSFPARSGSASIVADGAVATARANARRHGCRTAGRLRRRRLGIARWAARFDLVVANPPYVESAAIANAAG